MNRCDRSGNPRAIFEGSRTVDSMTVDVDVLEYERLVEWYVSRAVRSGVLPAYLVDEYRGELWVLMVDVARKYDGRVPFSHFFKSYYRTALRRTLRGMSGLGSMPKAWRIVRAIAWRVMDAHANDGLTDDEMLGKVREELLLEWSARRATGSRLRFSLADIDCLEDVLTDRVFVGLVDMVGNDVVVEGRSAEDMFVEMVDGCVVGWWFDVAGLTVRERAVLENVLLGVDAVSFRVLGSRLGVSGETVRNDLFRARGKLLHPSVLQKLSVTFGLDLEGIK